MSAKTRVPGFGSSEKNENAMACVTHVKTLFAKNLVVAPPSFYFLGGFWPCGSHGPSQL